MNPSILRFCIWVILGGIGLVILGCNSVVIFGSGNKANVIVPETHTIRQDNSSSNKATMADFDLSL